MSIPLAHAGHWYTTVLYIAPVVIVAVALWWSGRRGGPTVTVTPPSAGTLTIGVRATSRGGSSDTAEASATIVPDSVNPSLVKTGAGEVAGQSFGFSASGSTALSGVITDYSWDLDGDGTFESAGGASQSKTFSSPGTKTVRVRVTSRGGVSEAASLTFQVAPDTARAALAVAPASGLTGQNFTLSASDSTSISGGITRYEWDLDGNGSFESSGGATQTASFSLAGEKTVAVRITSSGGETDTATAKLNVRTAPPDGDIGASINDGAQYTNTPEVNLELVWPAMAGTARISNDGGFKSAQNRDVAPTVKWLLDSSGAERLPKTVYVRFVGGGGDTQTFQDDIILDQTPPVIASAGIASLASVSATPKLRTYRIKVRASDKTSGVAFAQVATDKLKKKLSVPQKYSASLSIKATSKPLWVRVRDRAGNYSKWKALP